MRAPWAVPFALLAMTSSLQAATNTIVTLVEDEVTNGNCTLREAILATIIEADVDGCAGDAGPDTIVLAAAGIYDLDDGELAAISSLGDLTVRGAAPLPRGAYVIDLGGNQRFAHLQSGARLELENLEITGGLGVPGVSGRGGGAIYSEGGNLAMRNVAISSCAAMNGGAIETLGSGTLDLEDVEISNNRADVAGGAVLRYGGGLRVTSFGSPPIRLVNVRFVGNRIVDAAPGHLGNGGAMALYSGFGGDLTFHGLVFQGNWIDVDGSGGGAGLYLDCEGAGVRFDAADLDFFDNQFVTSTASGSAAALHLEIEGFPTASLRRVRGQGNGSSSAGAQIVVAAGPPTTLLVSDVLLADGGGGGLEATSSLSPTGLVLGSLTVTGHPGNGVALFQVGLSSLRLENSIVFANALASGQELFLSGAGIEVSAENLIGIDPGFVNSATGDFHLAGSSVALNAGDASFASVGPFDLDHAPRVVGPEIDLGAFERGGLFADDYEAADTHAWTTTVP